MLQPCWVLAHLAAAHSIQHLPNLLHSRHTLVKLESGVEWSSSKPKPSSAGSESLTSVPALCSELHGAGWAVSRALPMFYSASPNYSALLH